MAMTESLAALILGYWGLFLRDLQELKQRRTAWLMVNIKYYNYKLFII
jgi:hypothetical protein